MNSIKEWQVKNYDKTIDLDNFVSLRSCFWAYSVALFANASRIRDPPRAVTKSIAVNLQNRISHTV